MKPNKNLWQLVALQSSFGTNLLVFQLTFCDPLDLAPSYGFRPKSETEAGTSVQVCSEDTAELDWEA